MWLITHQPRNPTLPKSSRNTLALTFRPGEEPLLHYAAAAPRASRWDKVRGGENGYRGWQKDEKEGGGKRCRTDKSFFVGRTITLRLRGLQKEIRCSLDASVAARRCSLNWIAVSWLHSWCGLRAGHARIRYHACRCALPHCAPRTKGISMDRFLGISSMISAFKHCDPNYLPSSGLIND